LSNIDGNTLATLSYQLIQVSMYAGQAMGHCCYPTQEAAQATPLSKATHIYNS
jgi:hypothetical protein